MEPKLASELLAELKRLLKAQKAGYAELAVHLGISESMLKKQMNAADCTLSRLEKICAFLGVNIADVIRSIEDQKLQGIEFTREQEDDFAKHRKGFLLYWLLVYERRSLDEARALLGLTERESWTLLHKLDRLKLLKIMPGDKLRLPHLRGIRWLGRSRFVRDLYARWSALLLKRTIAHLHEDNQFLMVRYFRMTPAAYEELRTALRKIEDDYSNKAIREMKLVGGPLLHVRWLMAADTRSFVEEELETEKVPGTF